MGLMGSLKMGFGVIVKQAFSGCLNVGGWIGSLKKGNRAVARWANELAILRHWVNSLKLLERRRLADILMASTT